jgi:hypothetical protein
MKATNSEKGYNRIEAFLNHHNHKRNCDWICVAHRLNKITLSTIIVMII